MSKKAIWLIIAAVVVIALVWLGVSRMKSNDNVVVADDAEVIEEVIQVETPALPSVDEVPAPAAE